MNVYLPILVLGAIAAAFAVVLGRRRAARRPAGATTAPSSRPTSAASSRCPSWPIPQAAGQRFPVKYYLTAMLFIVFDIEIVFLYPWAVAFDSLGLFALVEMLLFMVTVFVAYAYVWRRGGLTWD